VSDGALSVHDHLPDPRLPLSVRRVPVDYVVAPHRHEFQEIVYVVRGQARHVTELLDGSLTNVMRTATMTLLPGDCFVVSPDERHAFTQPESLVVYNILFTPELIAGEGRWLAGVPGLADFLFLEPLFRREAEHAPKLHLDVGERAAALACIEAMERETTDRSPGYELAARARLLELLVHLGRAWSRAGADRPAPLAKGQRDAVAAATAFMEERYGDDLSLRAIADAAYLSPHHFSELFKKRTGLSPWEYLGKLRIERAQELLRTGDAPITEVALAVGFSDSSYFARVFKTQTGLTPRDWRQRERG